MGLGARFGDPPHAFRPANEIGQASGIGRAAVGPSSHKLLLLQQPLHVLQQNVGGSHARAQVNQPFR
jgi:hypothetical protein